MSTEWVRLILTSWKNKQVISKFVLDDHCYRDNSSVYLTNFSINWPYFKRQWKYLAKKTAGLSSGEDQAENVKYDYCRSGNSVVFVHTSLLLYLAFLSQSFRIINVVLVARNTFLYKEGSSDSHMRLSTNPVHLLGSRPIPKALKGSVSQWERATETSSSGWAGRLSPICNRHALA